MTPQTGNVGTQVVLSVTYDDPQSAGNYEILWSQSQLFRDGETKVIKEGVISNGATSITAQLIVPESSYGIHFIRFKLGEGSETNFQFSVLPKLTINPVSATGGSVISVRGNGFPADDVILLKFDSQYLDTHITTNSAGSFASQIAVPDLAAGSYKLTAMTQLVSLSSSAAVEVLPTVVNSENNNQQTQNPPNTVITSNNSSNNNNPPIIEPGKESVVLPMPTPVSPAGDWIGKIGSQPVTLQWNRGNNRANLTYVVELNENHDFSSSPILVESGLTNSYFSTILEPGTYYWRVKAVDNEGNESYWAYSPYAFRVSEISITLNKIGEMIRNNSNLVILILIGIVAFVVLSGLVSFIRSLIQPRE